MNDEHKKKLLNRLQELLLNDDSQRYRLYQELLYRLDDFPKPIRFVASSSPEALDDAHHGVTDAEGKVFTVYELVKAISERDQAISRMKLVLRGRRDREAERLATRNLDILPLVVAVLGPLDGHSSLHGVDEGATVAGRA